MKVLIKEKLSPHKSETKEGYLICRDAILARTGEQEYYASEIYDDWEGEDKIVPVLRYPEDVFSPETLASFENKPITCEHPDEDVDAKNHNEYSVGFVRDIHRGKVDGQDVMLGNLIITDADTVNDIKQGIRTELSCGYNCDITKGDHPKQINIRGNHVALCSKGRAGNAKIVDSLDEPRYANPLKQLEDLAFDARSDVENAKDRDAELLKIYARLETLVHNSKGERQQIAVDMANSIIHHLKKEFSLKGENLVPFKVGDTAPKKKLPDAEKRKLQKYLGKISGFTGEDIGIEDIVEPIEGLFGYKLIRESINGWNKMGDGVMRKDYMFVPEGYEDTHIKISLYAPHDYEVNEVNAYITDTDTVNDELIQSASEEALKKNIATEIKAGKDPKQAAAIAYSVQRKNDSADEYSIKIDWGFKTVTEGYKTQKEADERYDDLIEIVKKPSLSGIKVEKLYDDSVQDDFRGEIVDTENDVVTSYRGYDIEVDENGDYIVELDNGRVRVESDSEAKDLIDDFLEKTESMLRDREISKNIKDDYSPYFKKEMLKLLAHEKAKIEEEAPEQDQDQTRLDFRKTKNTLLETLRKQIKNVRNA